MIVWDQAPKQLMQQLVFRTKEFQHKLPDRQRISCSSSSSWSQPDCSSLSLPTWVGKCSRLMASGTLKKCCLYRWILVFTILDRWQKAGGGVMVWAGVCYGQQTGTFYWCLRCSGLAYMTACSSSCQYLATLHSHWRRVTQHSTGHDQVYVKYMCFTAWDKWWPHQNPPQKKKKKKRKLFISDWPFIVANLRHTLCNSHAV